MLYPSHGDYSLKTCDQVKGTTLTMASTNGISALSTRNVPPDYLRLTFMVGKIPLTSSRADPRISYALYIPPHAYNPDPQCDEAQLKTHPSYALPRIPLIVNVHGTGRAVNSRIEQLIPLADSTHCAVLAPLFPCGLDGGLDLDSYKLIAAKTFRSDEVLLSIIDEVAQRWPGIDTTKLHMLGFSGGGQFCHRFLYLHPDRLRSVSIGAPGRVTHLDPEQDWPVGIRNVSELFGTSVDIIEIAKVRIQFLIGDQDNIVFGDPGFWEWLKTVRGKSGQGSSLPAMTCGRLETMTGLRDAWSRVGIESQLTIVPGAAHESDKVAAEAIEWLRSNLE